jgi:hypothetical protein
MSNPTLSCYLVSMARKNQLLRAVRRFGTRARLDGHPPDPDVREPTPIDSPDVRRGTPDQEVTYPLHAR